MDRRGDVAVVFFGDGATEEGAFHEAMNLAVVLRAPVLFVCENNLFASHLHIQHRQPTDSTIRYASAHGLPGVTVDGNDVVTVRAAAAEAVAAMRDGAGPHYLECGTYRWRGHVGHREDEDVGVKRKDDLAAWKTHDPIARLGAALIEDGVTDDAELSDRRKALYDQVEDAWRSVVDDPFPPTEALLNRVYVKTGKHDE
jgi:pyruvate dehydrogenase E1 component alpha subunit